MRQMDVILSIVHAVVHSVPDCSKCALAWISACTGDFENAHASNGKREDSDINNSLRAAAVAH